MASTFIVRDSQHPLFGTRVKSADGKRMAWSKPVIPNVPENDLHMRLNPVFRNFKGDSHKKKAVSK